MDRRGCKDSPGWSEGVVASGASGASLSKWRGGAGDGAERSEQCVWDSKCFGRVEGSVVKKRRWEASFYQR